MLDPHSNGLGPARFFVCLCRVLCALKLQPSTDVPAHAEDSEMADAQINNFCLVEPVLRAMGIRFDAQTAHSVMKGRPGAASTVVYKVLLLAPLWRKPLRVP